MMHAKRVLLLLHVHFATSNHNALSTQRVCSTRVSTYDVCVLCLGGLCVKCEE